MPPSAASVAGAVLAPVPPATMAAARSRSVSTLWTLRLYAVHQIVRLGMPSVPVGVEGNPRFLIPWHYCNPMLRRSCTRLRS